jgi:hypothetical protein
VTHARIILAIVLVFGLAGMGLWVRELKLDKVELTQTLEQRDGVIKKQNGDIQQLGDAVRIKTFEVDAERALKDAADNAGSIADRAFAMLIDGTKQTQQEIAHARIEDGPAAPALGAYAGELRQFEQRYASLRTSRGDAERLPEVRDPQGPEAVAASRLRPDFTQADFGAYCVSIKNTFSRVIGNVVGIDAWEIDQNKIIDDLNAKSAEAAAHSLGK